MFTLYNREGFKDFIKVGLYCEEDVKLYIIRYELLGK